MQIEIINAVKQGDYLFEQEIPLGLASIGAFLRTHNYNVIFNQYFINKGEETFSLTSDIYCFQLNMVNYESVKYIAEKIKLHNSKAITILGGPYLATQSENILKNESAFDFIVVGEGELTLLELIKAIKHKQTNFSSIKGLVWKNGCNIEVNPPRNLIPDLDALPFPSRDLLENAKRDPHDNSLIDSIRMITSRGCIGKCTFCCVNLYNKVQKGKRWRGRSPKNVVDELEYLYKTYNAKVFNFSDSSFEDPGNSGKIRSKQICEEIINRQLPISSKIYLRCESMKTKEDIDLLKLYKKAGIDVVIVGVESASDYELKFYEKHANIEDNYRMVSILKDLDIFYVIVGFIMFGPNSTMETIKSNIEFLHKFNLTDNIMSICNALMLFKDSKLYSILQQEGRVVDSGKPCDLPKYIMIDQKASRMVKHWQDPFARFPIVLKVNRLQVDIGNLISRMTNPMNSKVLNSLYPEFTELKNKHSQLSKTFGDLQYNYFIHTMELINNNYSDEELKATSNYFFIDTYEEYLPLYEKLYNDFINKIIESGYSLSGIVFNHALSSMVINKTEKTI